LKAYFFAQGLVGIGPNPKNDKKGGYAKMDKHKKGP
jgi:hypothetical protein